MEPIHPKPTPPAIFISNLCQLHNSGAPRLSFCVHCGHQENMWFTCGHQKNIPLPAGICIIFSFLGSNENLL